VKEISFPLISVNINALMENSDISAFKVLPQSLERGVLC
jgi:hypothetical protein